MILVNMPGYRFGIPDALPQIKGFRVVANREEFLQARRGNLNYIVRETPTHWIMERFGRDIWGRSARRKRREMQCFMSRNWMHQRKGYGGERWKGCLSIDPSEAIAVRKTKVPK